MFSYFEPNFIEKFLWESGFQILAKIEMVRNKNRYLAAILERCIIKKKKKSGIIIFNSAYIYGVNFIAKFRLESGFLRGFNGTPSLGTNGSKSTLVT